MILHSDYISIQRNQIYGRIIMLLEIPENENHILGQLKC